MSSYLWDKSGEPDPEVVELERLLTPLRLRETIPVLRPRRRLIWGGLAACLALGGVGFSVISGTRAQPTDWVFADGGRRVVTGERVRVDGKDPVALESEGNGRVELLEGSEMRVMESSPGRQLMQLQQGRMRALIWAPAGQFMVDTPSARAIDLGCQYELSVDSAGDGLVSVQTGWVAFQNGGHESFIPAGAACRTTKKRGPGIPFFEDARQDFRSALESFEGSGDAEMLHAVLKNARPDDGVTLWHLLRRVETSQRGLVFDRFAKLVPLPETIVRQKALAGDAATLDSCWEALGLHDAGWWRTWKRNWQ